MQRRDDDGDDDLPPLVDQPITYTFFADMTPASFDPTAASQPPFEHQASFDSQLSFESQQSFESQSSSAERPVSSDPIPNSQALASSSTAPPRGSHGKKRDASYIPRPPNAFILYRSSFIKSQQVTGKVEGNHSNLSKIIGKHWKTLPASERAEWEAKAVLAQAEHRARYPDWRFRPGANALAKLRATNRASGSGSKGSGKAKGKVKDGGGVASTSTEGGKKRGMKPRAGAGVRDAVRWEDATAAPEETGRRSPSKRRRVDDMAGEGSGAGAGDDSAGEVECEEKADCHDDTEPKRKRGRGSASEQGRGRGRDDRRAATDTRCAKIADLLGEGKTGVALEVAVEEWEGGRGRGRGRRPRGATVAGVIGVPPTSASAAAGTSALAVSTATTPSTLPPSSTVPGSTSPAVPSTAPTVAAATSSQGEALSSALTSPVVQSPSAQYSAYQQPTPDTRMPSPNNASPPMTPATPVSALMLGTPLTQMFKRSLSAPARGVEKHAGVERAEDQAGTAPVEEQAGVTNQTRRSRGGEMNPTFSFGKSLGGTGVVGGVHLGSAGSGSDPASGNSPTGRFGVSAIQTQPNPNFLSASHARSQSHSNPPSYPHLHRPGHRHSQSQSHSPSLPYPHSNSHSPVYPPSPAYPSSPSLAYPPIHPLSPSHPQSPVFPPSPSYTLGYPNPLLQRRAVPWQAEEEERRRFESSQGAYWGPMHQETGGDNGHAEDEQGEADAEGETDADTDGDGGEKEEYEGLEDVDTDLLGYDGPSVAEFDQGYNEHYSGSDSAAYARPDGRTDWTGNADDRQGLVAAVADPYLHLRRKRPSRGRSESATPVVPITTSSPPLSAALAGDPDPHSPQNLHEQHTRYEHHPYAGYSTYPPKSSFSSLAGWDGGSAHGAWHSRGPRWESGEGDTGRGRGRKVMFAVREEEGSYGMGVEMGLGVGVGVGGVDRGTGVLYDDEEDSAARSPSGGL